ncbi:MAG TPA: hypothetical protein VGL38_14790 [bacterium]|jgi:hypothetical protein
MDNKQPPFRKLRGYAFDPSLSLQASTVDINEVIYKVDWESKLDPGPIGEYVEVVDYDPTIDEIYRPVDLNAIYLLATEGLEPSDSNPQFHQQMVYAVAMTTIRNFELALGRKAIWNPRWVRTGRTLMREYVGKLRIYPHAMREANAYYSPQKKALLFGYFLAAPDDISLHMPGGLVFTCLSHDIIAHETTHALLDGMHSGYSTPTNPDVLAFHEAFADIVALFQHFTFPEVLKHQIARTRGDLEQQNLLGELAQEFGQATGLYGSLREAIGERNPVTGKWQRKKPKPTDYEQATEPHVRGSILVAAVFDAFLSIYKRRVADLLRIATGGTGVLPEGELHPDLVNRLAQEASKAAGHVLRMCVRALDYCPTSDITFGDYLRAIITADFDLVEDDARDYRLAFIEGFRQRGIYPDGMRTLSVESLLYTPNGVGSDLEEKFKFLSQYLRAFRNRIYYVTRRREIYNITSAYMSGSRASGTEDGAKVTSHKVRSLQDRIGRKFAHSEEFEVLTGLVLSEGWKKLGLGQLGSKERGALDFQVHSLRLANRVSPQGKIQNHIQLTLVQRVGMRYDPEADAASRNPFTPFVPKDDTPLKKDEFIYEGCCTLIFDLDDLTLKYVIRKPLLDIERLHAEHTYQFNLERMRRQHGYLFGEYCRNEFVAYFGGAEDNAVNEPFSFLHRTY